MRKKSCYKMLNVALQKALLKQKVERAHVSDFKYFECAFNKRTRPSIYALTSRAHGTEPSHKIRCCGKI